MFLTFHTVYRSRSDRIRSYDEPIVRVGPHSIEAAKVPGAAGLLFEGIRAAARAEDGR